MTNFWHVLQDRQGELWAALGEHIQISFIALLFAVLIAIPTGIYLTRRVRIAEGAIGTTAVLQTIPSLALLGLLIPLVGIGKLNAIIALVAYALLPILRNTYTGIMEVDAALVEAARAMGMNTWKRLFKVELPLALPVIMGGIRTGMVLIVGTTTLAALVGAGGLGDLILLGIDRNEGALIVLGAIPAAMLAIFFDILLRLIERVSTRMSLKKIGIAALVVLVIIIGALFFWNSGKKDLVIGGKLGAEPAILDHMYKILIEQDTDLNVGLETGLGKTQFVFKALQSGDIDIYPEFTGTAITTFLKEEAHSTNRSEVYKQAKKGMRQKYNMVLLEPMQYNNTYTLAVKKQTAKRFNLKTISDVKPVQNQIKAGFTLEFADRKDGYEGIQKKYGIHFSHLQTMAPSLRYQAVQSGEVNLVDAYSTDSELRQYHLKVLEDDRHLFPPYQGAPLLRKETLAKYPQLKDILNQLGGKISGADMREMNYRVDVKDVSPKKVAHDYLQAEGLLD